MQVVLKFLLLFVLVLCSSCGSSTTTTNYYRTPISVEQADKSKGAVLHDSIFAACWYMNDIEAGSVFGHSFSWQNVYPYILSFSNTSSVPIYFFSDSIPRFIPSDSLMYKSLNATGANVASGLLAGIVLPLTLTTERTDDAGNITTEYILPMRWETFAITGALGLIMGISSESQEYKEAKKYKEYIKEVSKAELVIPPGFHGYTVVFTKHYAVTDTLFIDSIRYVNKYVPNVPDSLPLIFRLSHLPDIRFKVPVTH